MSLLKQSHLRNARAKERLAELKALLSTLREGIFDAGFSDVELSSEQVTKLLLERYLGKAWSADNMLLLVSEIVLHLRAALDHIVFVCARIDSGREQDGTQFPINEKPEFFEKNRTTCLEHLTNEHIAL